MAVLLLSSPNETAAKEVLILYTNETSTEGEDLINYETFKRWLREIDTDRSRQMIDTLLHDSQEFPSVCHQEREMLFQALSHYSVSIPVICFSNHLARRNQCLVLFPGKVPRNVSFEVQKTGHLPFDEFPLCQTEVFRNALTKSAEIFSPSNHRFVLITKSHGDYAHAITTTLRHDYREYSRQKLASVLERNESSPPSEIGISKMDYLSSIQEVGDNHQMSFAAIFVESCKGTYDVSKIQAFPENIDRLYASGNRLLKYQSLDYRKLIKRTAEMGALSAALDEQLGKRYFKIHREKKTFDPLIWIWFSAAICFGGLGMRSALGRNDQQPRFPRWIVRGH